MLEFDGIKEKYTLTNQEIEWIQSLDLSAYEEFRVQPDELCYKEFSAGFDKAYSRQRGYIHGLSKKLGIDEYNDLPYYVKDIRFLNVFQAGEVIDILLSMEKENVSIF